MNRPARRPPLPRTVLTALEPRALLEFGLLGLTAPLLRRAPEGDGHPVLLLPGFAAGDATLRPLQAFLKDRGYAVETWGLGRNVGFHRKFANAIEQKVRYLHHRSGRKVSLVGWSLGGVFAFYAAHVAPECVRTVISMGSPLRVDPDGEGAPLAVKALYRALAHPLGPIAHAARMRARSLRIPPPVPSTCIYSESDGVIPPGQATIQGRHAEHENIRVPGSHLGLGVNFLAMWVIADRLAQPEGDWQPFEASGPIAPLYRALDSLPGIV